MNQMKMECITVKNKIMNVDKEKLQQLVDNFYEACSLCDELDIYEFEEADESMQEMKEWVNENFGRDLENVQ